MLKLINNTIKYLNSLDADTVKFFVETNEPIPQYVDNLLRRYSNGFDWERLNYLNLNPKVKEKQVIYWKKEIKDNYCLKLAIHWIFVLNILF